MLVPGVLLSTMSFSQNATKIVNDKDSTVVMSKKLVGYMIQDLINADADKQALDLLQKNMDYKDLVIKQKDEMISQQDRNIKAKEDLINQYISDEKDLTERMDKLKEDLNKKKQGNIFWKSAAAGLLVGLVVNHYAWKYGGKQ